MQRWGLWLWPVLWLIIQSAHAYNKRSNYGSFSSGLDQDGGVLQPAVGG